MRTGLGEETQEVSGSEALVSSGSDGPTARYYADVPNRLVALAIDAALLSFLIFAGAVLVSVLFGPAVVFDPTAESLEDVVTVDRHVAVVNAAMSLVLSAAYFAWSWAALGGTPAQRWLGMAVITEHRGDRARASRAFLRWLLLGAPFGIGALLTTAGLGALASAGVHLVVAAWYAALLVTTARSKTKQGWHDRVAETVVSKEGRPLGKDVATVADAR